MSLSALVSSARAFAAGQGNLHTRFSLGKRFELEFWERPGTWVDDEELSRMVADMRRVAQAGQCGKDVPMYGALLGDRKDLETRVISMVYDKKEKRPVGFASLTYFDLVMGYRVESVLHLGLVFVDPDYQGKGLPGLLNGAAALLLLFRGGLRGYWISNVSQVPAVVGLVSDNYAQVYPHYNGRQRQSFMHLTMARLIMRFHRPAFGVGEEAGFKEAQSVITNAYTGGSDELKKTFEDAPKYRRSRANDFCETHLDYERGDDFLQVGRCTMRSTLGFLASRLPKGGPLRLLFQGFVLFVLAVIAPVVQWLVPAPDRAAMLKSDDSVEP